ncbi:DNA/RNA helicase, DEAD/DEAH box type, N-terminal [Cynara cardunculus var. scolymus]|uniref:DNA 3'-5' helicase n=1 Tax=Cynara cardunculus var. scolymus TaxID=59895 RepID=A0A103XBW2_CYNCS|nr:DNA/RNA helicase, DEAD/DEAH box type, N-terminal [Cynara cardunculus var. scolymus]
MEGSNLASDLVIAELIGMGFQISEVTEAIKEVGPSLNNAIEFILNACNKNHDGKSDGSRCSSGSKKATRKRDLSATGKKSVGRMRQLSIMDHLQSAGRPKISKTSLESDVSVSRAKVLPTNGEGYESISPICSHQGIVPGLSVNSSYSLEEDVGSDWELRADTLLQQHFGYPSLKGFQKEALAAWIAHKDCLVLAATGSALLTGKVVVVISPLISLMHDQCLKLAKHGVSACFLGSGQIDHSVEQKAMRGMYEIIYVCPETILRLMKPLQSLAEGRGIALFAIDEVHCVSKWGHDFRPDYRRLSALRENFNSKKLAFLKFDIPIMALTATATTEVREDILKSLQMSEDPTIVLTSFFRPNLRFSVKHSSTSSSSYERDFCELVEVYTRNQKYSKKNSLMSTALVDSCDNASHTSVGTSSQDEIYKSWLDCTEERTSFGSDDDLTSPSESCDLSLKRKELSVEYLEDECDIFLDVNDFDGNFLSCPLEDTCYDSCITAVTYGEFDGLSSTKDWDVCASSCIASGAEGKIELEQGSTIVYVPTRKETLSIAKYLCRCGVKAAAYHAKLPKSQLRQVHREFHENAVQVVVATIAFGMGIDKLNVRRIIHYGWPQSLEAYYQEAGRAGRDGKLADCDLYLYRDSVLDSESDMDLDSDRVSDRHSNLDLDSLSRRLGGRCLGGGGGGGGGDGEEEVDDNGDEPLVSGSWCKGEVVLYANLSRMPSLLPNKRNEEQTRHAYKMLSDCFRYAIRTSRCRAQMLVQYFGEDFGYDSCHSCDVCVKGLPDKQNLNGEARILMQIIAAHYEKRCHVEGSYNADSCDLNRGQICLEKPDVKMFVSRIREQNQQLATTDLLWWRGLVRILEDKGFLIEGDERIHVQIKFPVPTKLGFEFLRTKLEEAFYVCPEADMLLSETRPKSYSSFAEWGKGWADPEIRKQRLARNRSWRQPRQRKKRKRQADIRTVRGRLAAKLSK